MDRRAAQVKKLSHYDDSGSVRMVDVSGKPSTRRTAKAHAFIKMSGEVTCRKVAA